MEALLRMLMPSPANNPLAESLDAAPLAGNVPELMFLRAIFSQSDAVPKPATREVGGHQHRFRSLGADDDAAREVFAAEGGDVAAAYLCSTCRAWIVFSTSAATVSPCPHPVHHYHMLTHKPGGANVVAKCCGCSHAVGFELRPPALPASALVRMNADGRGDPARVATARSLLTKIFSNVLTSVRAGKGIIKASKAYSSKLAAFAVMDTIFTSAGFTNSPDMLSWLPPDCSDPVVKRTLALAIHEIAFDAAWAEFCASATTHAPDPLASTPLIMDMFGYARHADTLDVPCTVPHQSACHVVGVDLTTRDDVVAWATERAISEAPHHVVALINAFGKIAKIRNSPALTAAVRRLADQHTALIREHYGLQKLGVPHDASDTDVIRAFNAAVARAPASTSTLRGFLGLVADGRPDSADIAAVLATYAADDAAAAAAASSAASRPPRTLFATEDDDLQRALLRSTQMSSPRYSASASDSPAAHLERAAFRAVERVGATPPGLVNIGQTCYFNSLLQALVSIQHFRTAVFTAAPPPPTAPPHAAAFSAALQQLFAYMTLGTASPYSSAKLMDALRTDSGEVVRIGAQQDASEYINMFLDQALAALAPPPPPDDASITALPSVADIFYGELTHTIERDGVVSSGQTQTFNQLILPLDAGSLPAALDAFVAPSAIDGPAAAATTTASLSSLPPVLIFHISRVAFSHDTMAGSKRNDAFDFPPTLSMAKYLADNAAAVAELRRTEARLRAAAAAAADAAAELDGPTGASAALATAAALVPEFGGGSPALTDGLASMAAAVAAKSAAIAAEREAIDAELASLYTGLDPDGATDYVLHAVLVHDGYALVGHYFVFVRNTDGSGWHKISDEVVTPADDAEVWEASIGGSGESSGYCFVYISAALAATNVAAVDPRSTYGAAERAVVPPGLAAEVDASNATVAAV